jgi:PPK2 family polyphosphate:nucleotide phosphotransferase
LPRVKTGLVTVRPGARVSLARIDPRATGEYSTRDEARERVEKIRGRIAVLQERLYAERRRSLLVILQALDTGGKDGALRNVFTGLDPAGVRVTSFKAPSTEELEHDFLWRIHRAVPPKGIVGVWNRSHYEDVLIVRVHRLVPESVCRLRYRHINDFERFLVESGVVILKFFLHISKEEQRERLQARLDDPTKHWKFNPDDLKERRRWAEYRKAYEEALSRCSTADAPWHVVPADRKWARDVAIAEKLADTLERMNPRYPKPAFDPSRIRIR